MASTHLFFSTKDTEMTNIYSLETDPNLNQNRYMSDPNPWHNPHQILSEKQDKSLNFPYLCPHNVVVYFVTGNIMLQTSAQTGHIYHFEGIESS